MKLGLPTGFEAILFAITNIAIQSAVNTFGTDTSAAWSAYGKLDAIFWMVSTAFGISITTFVGQNYGAGKLDRIRKSTRVCLIMDALDIRCIGYFPDSQPEKFCSACLQMMRPSSRSDVRCLS